jgi:AraC-like DNA-binding protein
VISVLCREDFLWYPSDMSDSKFSPLLHAPLTKTLCTLFDHLPDTCFFVKDSASRFVHVNRALLERLGLREVGEIAGTTDHDRYPPHIARQLVEDDREAMTTGQPLVARAEVLFDRNGRLEWFSTTKYPVIEGATALGIAGITRRCGGGPLRNPANHGAAKAIELVIRDPQRLWTVEALAAAAGLSTRQLNRQFLAEVGMGPRDFLLKTRLHAAAGELRQGSEAIIEIAAKYGFCDQSAFTRQFRRILGTTPALYRSGFGSNSHLVS